MTFAFVILILAGIYFLLLGIACLFARTTARRFLMGFAGSASKHYLEMTLRMIVGIAMVVQAPYLPYAPVFTVVGWLLVGTTTVLFFIPWTWHRRFAEKVLPSLAGLLPLIGIVSIAMGSGILFCLIRFAVWGELQ